MQCWICTSYESIRACRLGPIYILLCYCFCVLRFHHDSCYCMKRQKNTSRKASCITTDSSTRSFAPKCPGSLSLMSSSRLLNKLARVIKVSSKPSFLFWCSLSFLLISAFHRRVICCDYREISSVLPRSLRTSIPSSKAPAPLLRSSSFSLQISFSRSEAWSRT